VAIVTGASGDIGRAIAKSYLENGASVIIADVNDEQGEKTVETLTPLGPCCYIHTDVTSPESVNNLLGKVIQEFKRVDLFVNNAGINVSGSRVDIDAFSQQDWDRILAVNLTGVFQCSQAVSKIMIDQKTGRIINIGSALGEIPARKQIAFVASKGGLHHMTKAMALELAPHGILVNGVAPGSILTESTRKLFYSKTGEYAEFALRLLSHVPLNRPGEVEDIAHAVLFLSGKESQYITGHILTVDGGWTCGYARDF
jgi:NAD(P)-dependent dehydrogenase (short-subunit alcohol dehydrogenase family)